MLAALPAVSVETVTPWSNGVTEFEGPLVRESFEFVAARESCMKASAINDYVFDIPTREVLDYPGHPSQDDER